MTGMEFIIATLLPIFTLCVLAVVLPLVLADRFEDSQGGLARAVGLTFLALVGAGAVLFFLLYQDQGVATGALLADPVVALRHFLWLGVRAALFWGPVLALSWFSLATGVERRKGERLARRDPD